MSKIVYINGATDLVVLTLSTKVLVVVSSVAVSDMA